MKGFSLNTFLKVPCLSTWKLPHMKLEGSLNRRTLEAARTSEDSLVLLHSTDERVVLESMYTFKWMHPALPHFLLHLFVSEPCQGLMVTPRRKPPLWAPISSLSQAHGKHCDRKTGWSEVRSPRRRASHSASEWYESLPQVPVFQKDN